MMKNCQFMKSMAQDLNCTGNGSINSVPSLLTLSVRTFVGVLPHHLADVVWLPLHIKNQLLNLMSKRGLVTDGNIEKVVHSRTKVLDLGDCDFTDEGLQKINVCKYLKKLDLNSAKESRTTITSTGLQVVAQSCQLLEVLYLRRCLNVTDTGLISLARNCCQLREINIGGCSLVTDASLIAISQNCHMLKSFNFSKTLVTNQGVESLALGACQQSLMEVLMNDCIHLTDEAVEAIFSFCPRISILMFHGCPCITDRSRQILDDRHGMQSHIKQVSWTVY